MAPYNNMLLLPKLAHINAVQLDRDNLFSKVTFSTCGSFQLTIQSL